MSIQPGDVVEVSVNGVTTEKVVERVTYERRHMGMIVDLSFRDGTTVGRWQTKSAAMTDHV